MARFVCSIRYSHLIPESMHSPDLRMLEQLVLRPELQFHDAGIDYFADDGRRHWLTAIEDSELGYYLQLFDPRDRTETDDVWLSLGDRARLGEILCPDDWEASAGLFIARPLAWQAIRYFCTTGSRSGAIEWIRPTEMPESGNW